MAVIFCLDPDTFFDRTSKINSTKDEPARHALI